MGKVAIVGTGYAADLYMRSLRAYPDITVAKAYDTNEARLGAFSSYWNVPAATSLDDALNDRAGSVDLVLNLTNPHSHFAVSKHCLEAGRSVYSEKPLATTLDQALDLHALAKAKALLITSAPCSVLGKAAQTAWLALRNGEIGKPLLVYAELDDDFVPLAPYERWKSESGAPWPYRDEFKVGCTLEHAGYYLTWLMAMFGSVRTVVSCAVEVVPCKTPDGSAPDFSNATLVFESGVVARLTCSIVAPHDHSLRVFGDRGVLEVAECWNNVAPVRVRRRHVIRGRLINSPIARRVILRGPTHPIVGHRHAASMNFALGPAEVLSAIKTGRPSRLDADFALHLTEVTLAIQNSGTSTGAQNMITTCPAMDPMPWAKCGKVAGAVP
ncbi:Gfo/Idh/MocA family protein [Rubellimicrobium mesophilum]|nr:Gfo/Idh/MocA family oxidoreductase [Rubellimicrobium mesophilum]